MPKYVKCPRCDLNYMREGEEYCDVCKAQLKKGPQLIFAIDDEDESEMDNMELCPICHKNYIEVGQTMCKKCAEDKNYQENREDPDDESWKEYLDQDDDDVEEEQSEEMLSLAKLVEEEGDELFDDEEEEEDIVSEPIKDDFDMPEFDGEIEDDEDEEEEEEDDEDF